MDYKDLVFDPKYIRYFIERAIEKGYKEELHPSVKDKIIKEITDEINIIIRNKK